MTMEQKDLSHILEVAIVAARLAGQRAMEEIDYTTASVKNNRELVTQTDYRCQQIITERIKENFPDHGFIGEESGNGNIFIQPPRRADSIWWIIDPIDGTNNFAHKVPVFTVSIAALEQGRPVVGVIFEPATESMYTAVINQDAQLNSRRITASDETISQYTSIALDSHFDSPDAAWVRKVLTESRFRNFGTAALHFAYVAQGGLVASISCCAKLWDLAAGVLICQAAGATVTDWQGKNIFPLQVHQYQGQEFTVLAANKKVHPELLKMLQS